MKVTNNVNSPLGLPNGPVIMPKTTVLVPDWDNKSSNSIVKAWIEMGALTVSEAAVVAAGSDATNAKSNEPPAGAGNTEPNNGAGSGNGNGAGSSTEDARADAFRAMTVPELAALITENGGTVKNGMLKDDLVALALETVKA